MVTIGLLHGTFSFDSTDEKLVIRLSEKKRRNDTLLDGSAGCAMKDGGS